MKLLVLAVLLAVMQANAPVQRKAPDNAAAANTNIKTQPATQQAPSSDTPASANQNQPASPNGNRSEKGRDDTQHPIVVRELPPVSVTRDWADWGIWVFSGLLVVVGFLQVWLLFRTWKAISKQNLLAEFAQQPWVELTKWRIEEEEGTIECEFEVHNPTRIPITLRKVVTEVAPMRHRSIRKSYEVTENLMLPPHDEYVCRVPIILRKEDMADYRASKFFVLFSVTVFILNAEKMEIGQGFQQVAVVAPKKIRLYQRAGAVPDECIDERHHENEPN